MEITYQSEVMRDKEVPISNKHILLLQTDEQLLIWYQIIFPCFHNGEKLVCTEKYIELRLFTPLINQIVNNCTKVFP